MQDFNAVSQNLHKNVWMEIQLLFQTLSDNRISLWENALKRENDGI